MKKYSLIILIILFLAIGFAAVSTNLIINGTTIFGTNEDDFDVIFTKSVIDGIDVSESTISEDGASLTFTTSELAIMNDTSVLDFEVANNSTQYDASVQVECINEEGEHANTYYKVGSDLPEVINAASKENGNITVTLLKTSVDEIEETFTCTISATATERTNVAEKMEIYNIGDEIMYKGESFYVIDFNDKEITLLTKYNIDINSLSQKDITYNEYETHFSKSIYWNTNSSYPLNLIVSSEPNSNNYAEYYAYKYGEKMNGIGRMLYYDEALSLLDIISDQMYGKYATQGYLIYWLGTASDASKLWCVYGHRDRLDSDNSITGGDIGVRPVITISKDLINN